MKLDRDERMRRAAVREAVFRRDRVCVLSDVDGAGTCWPTRHALTPHHKRKASQGGPYTEDNLVAMCPHHNDAIEADADLAALAHRLGYVIKRGDQPQGATP